MSLYIDVNNSLRQYSFGDDCIDPLWTIVLRFMSHSAMPCTVSK